MFPSDIELKQFLEELFTTDVVNVTSHSSQTRPDYSQTQHFLSDFELRWRTALGVTLPDFRSCEAMWSALVLHRAAVLLTHREMAGDFGWWNLPDQPDDFTDPATIYSIDLVLRFLPDLRRLFVSVNRADPVLAQVDEFAAFCPFSATVPNSSSDEVVHSTSSASAKRTELASILDHPGLRLLYLERIYELDETARPDDPQVAEHLRAALGQSGNTGQIDPSVIT